MGTATNSLPVIALETKHLTLKRIGWLYPIFRDLHFYHGPLARISHQRSPGMEAVGYPFDSGSHKMLWSRESIYQEANPEVTALARRGAA